MARYGQLLIDAGGGIIDHQKQSKRQKGANVIIGLGGTGSDAVIKLKKEVYKQLQPDDLDATVPTYKGIKFLIVDSDDAKLNEQNGGISDIDRGNEYFDVSNKTIVATLKATDVLKNRHELDWMDYEHISMKDAAHGAGGIRQIGRFLLVDKAAGLYTKLRVTIEAALREADSDMLDIHICAGISGGTGSGTFLDVCYLLRKVLDDMGKSEASVSGYFFLPDVNLSVPEVLSDPLISSYIRVNGYCALQELDYCMNFDKNLDSFVMNYGFDRIDDHRAPVDLCYLVSTTDAEGKRINNGYKYAMGVVSDYIISFLAQVSLPDGVAAGESDNGMTLKGHIANLVQIKNGIKPQHGAGVEYNILGASIATMPLAEIATYLGCKLFDNFKDMYDKTPTEQERNGFLTSNQLDFDNLLNALKKGCAGQVMFAKTQDDKLYKTKGNATFVERADAFLAENSGHIEKNLKTLLEEMTDFHIPEQSTSLVSRTYKALCNNYVTKLDFGPFYAQRMLYGNHNQNLIHAIDGYIERNQQLLDAEIRQNKLRDDGYNDAKARMDQAGLLNSGKRMEEYKHALNLLYVHHFKIELHQKMDTLLRGYRDQLIKLNNTFFRVLTEMLENLRDTFADNYKVLSEGTVAENPYTWRILTIKEIQEGLDIVVKNLDLDQTMTQMMQAMIDKCKEWISQDEAKITRMISDFILEVFGDATRKTMTDYLREKFQTSDTAQLSQAIRKQILEEQLKDKSTPLFWLNPMYHTDDKTSRKNTITVPYDSAEIKSAATALGKDMGATVRPSSIIDRLSMMQFHSGLPLFAYQGIVELEKAYEVDTKAGRHLYETGDKNWNRILPSPIPDSFKVGIPIERIRNKNDALIAEFKEAVEVGVVKKDEALRCWNIMTTADFDADHFMEQNAGGKAVADLDPAAYKALIEKVKAAYEELKQNETPHRIKTMDTTVGNEELVMMDFYLLSPVMNDMLGKELKKRKAIEDKIAQMEQNLGSKIAGGNAKTEFFNAIFTGVLPYAKKIGFTYTEFGMEKTIELQNNSMEYGSSGAFCAYENYQKLDDAMKKRIITETQKRMDEEESPEVRAAVDDLNAKMPQRIAGYMSIYAGDLRSAEIEAFYNDFMKEFQSFKLINMYM